jgi:hypothetical protein
VTSPSDPMVEWLRYPEAEAFVAAKLDRFVSLVPPARSLQADLILHTNSRLVDWLDHLVLADGDVARGQLADLGFEVQEVPAELGDVVFHHPGALFPNVVLRAETGGEPGEVVAAAIQVEDASAFLMTHRVHAPVEGSPLSPYRRAQVWQGPGLELWVVERRGHQGLIPVEMPPDYLQLYLRAFEKWATRPRQLETSSTASFDADRQAMARTLALARTLVSELGTDTAAWVAFAAERAYWQRRNKAGQIQKGRQDRLGMGWANHDHHTFRSSRQTFDQLIQILETFGFHPRERFYAGAEAGWGAQVMEQPACRFAVFADVDLAPDEVEGDFAHRPLAPRPELGTVGLWCALHGESMLGAGLHHLAGRFDFQAATTGLAEWGIGMMEPFSRFSYLWQAFTKGERWEVSPERLERLAATGKIDHAQVERFADGGTVGSHLENIQRGEGFKGFNQQMVSDIIRRTDPRLESGAE